MGKVAALKGRWGVPSVSGVLILTSWALARLAGAGLLPDLAMLGAAAVAGTPVLLKAVRSLRVKVIGIDLLVSVAVLGAIALQNYWEAAAVTFLFAVGHALEASTLAKTRSALAELIAVAPEVAVVLIDGEQVEMPAASVPLGATVLVKNGSKVPVDGLVTGGFGAVDEASITGESIPAEKAAGDKVFSGTLSTGGLLQVVATGVGADTTLARIIHRVEEAQEAKAKVARFMDRFSAWYTPGIMVLAIVIGLLTRDVVLALTLLVIACPGALVISIPVSIVAGIGRGARDGILIKGGEYLEAAARIDAVALDKTGTLTRGRPRLSGMVLAPEAYGWDEDGLLELVARAEAGSEHPLARPLLEAAAERGLATPGLPEHTEPVPGKGIVAVLDGVRVAVGNVALLEDEDVTDVALARRIADDLAASGQTPLLVSRAGSLLGAVAVSDEVRPDAAEMVARLHSAGVRRVIMLTGDVAQVADAVGAQVGIDEVRAGLLPEEKLEAVLELQRNGHTVAMVGDGVNDAPALALADIGVAMGVAGTAVAIETADIALMRDDLLMLPEAVSLARRTVANLRQNIVVALVTVVSLMLGVLFGGVTMAIGMLVHEASVLIVILNAMRLMRAPRANRGSIRLRWVEARSGWVGELDQRIDVNDCEQPASS